MTDEELLGRMLGEWQITGVVRGAPLTQRVSARRSLAGQFVELRVTDGTPPIEGSPYEAAYFIGAAGDGRFVMNLMDVFGAAYSPVPGLGTRDGDDIVFEFAYPAGLCTWRWSPSGPAWNMTQTCLENGEQRPFATKRMERLA